MIVWKIINQPSTITLEKILNLTEITQINFIFNSRFPGWVFSTAVYFENSFAE
jgi:hypothetical protein